MFFNSNMANEHGIRMTRGHGFKPGLPFASTGCRNVCTFEKKIPSLLFYKHKIKPCKNINYDVE